MRYSDELLDRFRQMADPAADRLMESLGHPGQVGALIPRLVAVPAPVPGDLPGAVAAWLDQHARLPGWADRERLDRASRLWVRRGVTMAVILGTASLAECYAAARGVKALTFSNRLQQDTYRRLRETVLWVNLLMLPGGLADGGEGVRAAYKIRLMHAAVRHLIGRAGRWDGEALGVPLCQEDLAGTLMTFAYTVLRSLEQLGVPLSERDAADYLHFWAVVGEMMGVRPELLPESVAEARELTAAIFRRQHGPSHEGKALMAAVLRSYGPGRFFPALIRHLSGDGVADLLEVPAGRRPGAVWAFRVLASVADLGWWAWNGARGAGRRLAGEFGARDQAWAP